MGRIIRFFKKLFGFGKETSRDAISSSKRFALVVGIERSVKFGSCPGSRTDSNRLRRFLSGRCAKVEFLQDNSATKNNILQKMEEQIARVPADGIFVMTYSGHGGSQKFVDTKNEPDGKDEYLCCYDTYLRDDLIWNAVSRCRGKVFLFFDCCHSETMFRAPIIPPEDLMREDDIAGVASRDGVIPESPVDMLVWSGCPDDTYSYGDANGGLMTNAFFSAVGNGLATYRDIWASIKSDKALSRYSQIPQQTVLGKFDTNAELLD